jgi:hypothetical protein
VTNGSCDLTGAHLFTFRQQRDDGEGNGVAEKTPQPRLPIGHLLHGAMLVMFSQCEKVKIKAGQAMRDFMNT